MNQYLIWSFQKSAWWKPMKRGYTQYVKDAGVYTLEAAIEICNDANKNGKISEAIVPLIESIKPLSLPMGYSSKFICNEDVDT